MLQCIRDFTKRVDEPCAGDRQFDDDVVDPSDGEYVRKLCFAETSCSGWDGRGEEGGMVRRFW